MADKPQQTPWEAEMQAEALREEYAKRGEIYDPNAEQVDTAPNSDPAPEPPPETEATLDEDEQDRLVQQFELEFAQQTVDNRSFYERLPGWLATNEGRVVIIAAVTCIALILIGRWLTTLAASKLPVSP